MRVEQPRREQLKAHAEHAERHNHGVESEEGHLRANVGIVRTVASRYAQQVVSDFLRQLA